MQIIAHGIDIVRCDRIRQMWDTHRHRFLERVYTPAERDHCLAGKLTVTRLSGRFAAKEAVLKALGTGWRGGIHWTDIETLPDPLGKPVVTLHGQAARLAQSLRITRVLLSISHTREYALASAVAVSSQEA